MLSKTVTISGSSNVVFAKVFTNAGNAYDSKTGIFRAPVKGLYYFNCNFLSDGSKLHIVLVKDNNKLTYGHSRNTQDAGSITGTLELQKGDKVSIQHYSAVGSETMQDSYSSFTGYLISTS